MLQNSNFRTPVYGLVFALLCAAVQIAEAARIRIEFSGEFADCTGIHNTCDASSPFFDLFETNFSGVVEFPDTGIDLAIEGGSSDLRPQDGDYVFAAPAFMSLTSELAQYDISPTSPVGLQINPAAGIGGIFIYASGPQADYVLRFSAPDGTQIDNDEIPTVEFLQSAYPYFYLIKPEPSSGNNLIGTSVFWTPPDYPMSFTVTSVPLPMAICGFFSGLVLLGARLFRRDI